MLFDALDPWDLLLFDAFAPKAKRSYSPLAAEEEASAMIERMDNFMIDVGCVFSIQSCSRMVNTLSARSDGKSR